MTTVLLIAWAEQDTPWAQFSDGVRTAGGTGLDSLKSTSAAQVWLVVPGVDVTVRPVKLPPKSDAKLRAMLPFVLEDELAVGTEGLHLAISSALEDGGTRLAAAVARDRFEDWLATLRDAGLAPDVVTPDFLALPLGVHVSNDRVMVRRSEGGCALERETAEGILEETLPEPVSADVLLELFHGEISARPALNLLQGSYAPRRRQEVEWGRWRQPALLAAAAVVAHLLYLGIDGWRHQSAAERVDGQTEAVLREAFPDIKRIVNPQAQMRARLAELNGGASDRFLMLTRFLFEGLQPLESACLRSLRFDEAKGELAAEILYASYDELEAMKKAIVSAGGSISEGSSRQGEGGMIGNVTVRMP